MGNCTVSQQESSGSHGGKLLVEYLVSLNSFNVHTKWACAGDMKSEESVSAEENCIPEVCQGAVKHRENNIL